MRKRTIIVLLSMFVVVGNPHSALFAEETYKEETVENKTDFDWNPIIDAIIQVESEGNTRAVNGNNVGAMQITPILVSDCNRILEMGKSQKRFKLSDRYNVEKSKEMFLLIQSVYNPTNDIEKAIRTWNGGVNFKERSTQRYYEKVMQAMK